MPIESMCIYKIISENEVEDIIRIITEVPIKINSKHGVELKFDVINYEKINNGDYSLTIAYDLEEGPFLIQGDKKYIPVEKISNLLFYDEGYMIIFERSNIADTILMKIIDYYFDGSDVFLKITFSNDAIKKYLDENEHIIKHVIVSELNLPGVSRASLYGSDVELSNIYESIVEFGGNYNYIIFKLLSDNVTIGINKKGSIVTYTKMSLEELIAFITRRILNSSLLRES